MLSIFRLSLKDIDLTGKTLVLLQSWPSKLLAYSATWSLSLIVILLWSSETAGILLLILFSALAIAVMAANFFLNVYLLKALWIVSAAVRALIPPYLRSRTSICLSRMSWDNSYLERNKELETIQWYSAHLTYVFGTLDLLRTSPFLWGPFLCKFCVTVTYPELFGEDLVYICELEVVAKFWLCMKTGAWMYVCSCIRSEDPTEFTIGDLSILGGKLEWKRKLLTNISNFYHSV